MEIIELRNKIIEIVNTSEVRFLHMINALHKTYQEEAANENKIVAYTPKGKPLTTYDIIKNNNEAIQSIKSGDYKTHADNRQKYAIK